MGTSPDTWTAAAEEVITRAPAAVLLSDYMLAPTVEFIRAFLSKPSPTLLYCIYSPSIPGFRTRLGPLVNGVLWATVTGTYSDPIGRAFASRYRAQFGVAPGRSHAGIAYDRVRLIANAWALASNPRDFAAVADVLRTNTYRGVNGAYFLGSVDQVALSYPDVTADPSVAQAHLVYQFQGLRHRIVSPAPYRDARFETPHWIEP
jgi:branched-chain amino acid transport system substrate-binding protein